MTLLHRSKKDPRHWAAMTLVLLLVLAMAAPAWADAPLQSAAEADEAQADAGTEAQIDPLDDVVAGRHRIYRRGTRHRTYYRRYPHHRSVVVVQAHDPAPVVAHRSAGDRFSAGFRAFGMEIEDTALAGDELFAGDTFGGVGVYMRGKFMPNFGLEITVDVAGNTSYEDFNHIMVPVTAGFMAHLFPDSVFDLYGIVGGGILFNTVDYQPMQPARQCIEHYTQFLGQLGGGMELDLGALELIVDARYLLLQARPERGDTVVSLAPLPVADEDADSLTNAFQFSLGLGGNF